MKRLLIVIIALLVAIPLTIGVMAGVAYYTTDESSVPAPKLLVMGQEVAPAGYDWHEPVFGGVIYRDFSYPPIEGPNVASLSVPNLTVEAPAGYEVNARLLLNNEEVWSGDGPGLAAYQFINNGRYKLELACERSQEGKRGWGAIHYLCSFTVAVEPRLEVSDEWVQQGDLMALRVYNLPTGMVPKAETGLGEVCFMQTGNGIMTAYVPIGHAREPALYSLVVTAGQYEWEATVRVIETSFPVESLVVQVEEDPAIPEEERQPVRLSDVASASPADYREYSEKIVPLFETWEENKLWSGLFSMPVKANVTVPYGQTTYASSVSGSLRQSGLGIAAEAGAPVVAPNGGKVIFAEDTDNMGTVVVIEHGGGLKSLFFFVTDLEVEVGDTVTKDQKIAAAPAKGWSSKASVYYEARLGYETLDPTSLYGGNSSLYYFS
ncbi:M23 family metallopeptidase [Ruminococcaceae bacterium OttesenSCG-928-D13]|nr:M23 family metallopeptidase [Ruminococcaceae bacterium OttesenSCG-928-D13]